MDLQEETTMLMGASKTSHHQRMAYRIFRQSRTPYYPQIRRPYTLIAEILQSIISQISAMIFQSALVYG